MKKIVCLGAHPDDIELGCAGSIAKFVAHGHSVKMVVLTDGEYTTPTHHRPASTARREQKRSAELLRAELSQYGYKIDGIYVNKSLISMIEKEFVGADVAIIPSAHEVHHDHRATHLLGVEVARKIPTVLCYESSIISGRFSTLFSPNAFVDISERFLTKMHALSAHRSEYKKNTTWKSQLETRAKYRGMQVGFDMAEAFEVIRSEFNP